jgi:hypothetical protein
MSHRLISAVLRKVAWIGTVGAVSFALAGPFSAAPSALASQGSKPPPPPSHAYNVTLSCTSNDSLGSAQAVWKWYQGGTSGTVLASGSLSLGSPFGVNCGGTSVTFSGTQPKTADTLFADIEVGRGGCGGDAAQTVSFTPGSSVSLDLSALAKSPCSYQTNWPKGQADGSFALHS